MRGSWFFILWLAGAVILRATATAALTVLTSLAVILWSSALSALRGAPEIRRDRAARERTAPDGPSALYGHGSA